MIAKKTNKTHPWYGELNDYLVTLTRN